MYFKKLIGQKCYLSPIDENDAEKFTEWLNDLEVAYNINFHNRSINVEKEKEILNKLSKEHNYSIIDINTNGLLGNCGYNYLDHLNQTGEIGIIIGNKDYWNKGYGTEAIILLLDYGFKALNLHNISLWTNSFNKRAIKCYEKVGFKRIGNRREALLRGKERYDEMMMDILSIEFYEKWEL
jgi:RimJ/RimL family protein N-acetyltransferase